MYFRLLSHLPDDAVQLYSLPKGALCFFDVSQLLPKKGEAAYPHGKKFGADAAPSGRAVAFNGEELCVYAFGYAALLSIGNVVAPQWQANAKAGESTNF